MDWVSLLLAVCAFRWLYVELSNRGLRDERDSFAQMVNKLRREIFCSSLGEG